MNIVRLDSESLPLWRRFCETEADATFWHSDSFIDYSLNHKPDLGSQPLSFLVEHDNRTVAICPLVLERYSATSIFHEHSEFTFGGAFGPLPAITNSVGMNFRQSLVAAVYAEIDSLAKSTGAVRVMLKDMPMRDSYLFNLSNPVNPLLKFGYQDASIATQVIDLSATEDDLIKSMRKGHRADIKRSSDLLSVEMFSGQDTPRKIFDEYVKLHALAAGRSTRPQITFDIMYEWITSGRAVLAAASHKGRIVGFTYSFLSGSGAYYASACNATDFRHIPVAHQSLWGTIKWLKSHGFSRFETGWQQFGPQHIDVPTEKELNIESFKRGFGGDPIPLFQGEKYYDREFYKGVMNQRTEQVASALFDRKK
jgi:hypothetical protein